MRASFKALNRFGNYAYGNQFDSIKALIRLVTMIIVLLNFFSHTYTVGTVLTAAYRLHIQNTY